MLDNELVGLWGADPQHYDGSPGHDWLVFKPDGTGRYEFINWILCSADLFHWDVPQPGVLRIVGEQHLQVATDLRSLEERPSLFSGDALRYEIAHEEMQPGKRMRVLRIPLKFPMRDCFGFRRADLTGLENPKFDLEV